ncbi:uncharacterized protein LOC111714496 isoform X2 [Eurytemora carolleeae]|uniref:uncharacterized protein LOC111714496 isoform X2 n=1 Tax=Eurytemora carolleeae TaxID=1294199 RepID=UPI000C7891BB|nr:uncharacterized protein LOC111714496 isoform X2 [Eurytemora carolleeae]|eukprot:XP_023345388.1 uncharacterized protein LOC111714496 isoform X2 [Eurytemora affinis]
MNDVVHKRSGSKSFLRRSLSVNGKFSSTLGESCSENRLTVSARALYKNASQESLQVLNEQTIRIKDIASHYLRIPETWSRTKLIQKILPTNFSMKVQTRIEDYNEVSVPVYIHVYRLKDSDLGFYHTGIEIYCREYTYCCSLGIVQHDPRLCDFGDFLGTIYLGDVNLTQIQVEDILIELKRNGFDSSDYDVMKKSCNTFTEVFSERLGVLENFPSGVHTQTKLGRLLSPVVKALDFAVEKSLHPSGSVSSLEGLDSGDFKSGNFSDKTDFSGSPDLHCPANSPILSNPTKLFDSSSLTNSNRLKSAQALSKSLALYSPSVSPNLPWSPEITISSVEEVPEPCFSSVENVPEPFFSKVFPDSCSRNNSSTTAETLTYFKDETESKPGFAKFPDSRSSFSELLPRSHSISPLVSALTLHQHRYSQ